LDQGLAETLVLVSELAGFAVDLVGMRFTFLG